MESRSQSKAAHNNASQCGHPCLRFLYYRRHPDHWDKAISPGERLLNTFWIGRELEDSVVARLRDAGIDVVGQQVAFYDEGTNLSGMIDGEIRRGSSRYPIEIKTMVPYTWEKINKASDLINFDDSRYYYRNYYHQMNMYLYLTNKESGVFVLLNRLTGQIKIIQMEIDWDRADFIAKRMDTVNRAMTEGVAPDPINNWDICPNCSFYHHCTPELTSEGQYEGDEDIPAELIETLDAMEKLKPAHKEYEALNKYLKGMIVGKNFFLGKYLIGGTWIEETEISYTRKKHWKPNIKVIEPLPSDSQ
jgi:CRISPR/Cas system-associated exonuclease Cas4 (RecB family)